jgi:hypothetical protein
VAIIAVIVRGRLGLRTIEAPLDASPWGAAERIKARAEQAERVLDSGSFEA